MSATSRETKQRATIRDILLSSKKPLQPKEIQAKASRSCPNLGLATIYRNLKKLESEGMVDSIQLPGMARCYASPCDRGAVLLYCNESGHSEFLSVDASAMKLPPLPDNFELDRYEIVIRGQYRNGESEKK